MYFDSEQGRELAQAINRVCKNMQVSTRNENDEGVVGWWVICIIFIIVVGAMLYEYFEILQMWTILYWLGISILVVQMNGFFCRVIRKSRNFSAQSPADSYLQEIEGMDVSRDERELFFLIIAEVGAGSIVDAADLIEEAMKTSLAGLSLIRDMYKCIRS